MFAIFGLGLGEIVVIVVIGSVLAYAAFAVARFIARNASAAADVEHAKLKRLQDQIEELRTEVAQLREENDRLRETGAVAAATPPETGIKQSEN
jgi:cell division protein FtsB